MEKKEIIKTRLETEKVNYLQMIITESSREFESLSEETKKENKDIFDFLYSKISETERQKLAKSVLFNYNPKLNFEPIEKEILNFKTLESGSKGGMSYSEKVPLLDYLYDAKNTDLFAYLRKKYKLPIGQKYTVERQLSVVENDKRIEKLATIETNIVDMAYSKCFNSFHKGSVEEAIAPLTAKDLKQVGFSELTKMHLQRVKSLSHTRSVLSSLSGYKNLEHFVEMVSPDLVSEVGEGSIKCIIKEWVDRSFYQSDKDKESPLRKNLVAERIMYEDKYSPIFDNSALIRIEKYALLNYKEKIKNYLAKNLEELGEKTRQSKQSGGKEGVKERHTMLDKIIKTLDIMKESMWADFNENFNYRGHNKKTFFDGLNLVLDSTQNNPESLLSNLGLGRIFNLENEDLLKIVLSLKIASHEDAPIRQIHKI